MEEDTAVSLLADFSLCLISLANQEYWRAHRENSMAAEVSKTTTVLDPGNQGAGTSYTDTYRLKHPKSPDQTEEDYHQNIKILQMPWINYIIPVVVSTTLMSACWIVGHWGLSFLWIILFGILYVVKTHYWIRREQKRMRLRNMIIREREAIMAQFSNMGDLPTWVQFPDTERIEWVNKIIQQLWPFIGQYAKHFLREFVEPQVISQMPSPFKSFKFLEIDCGDLPCRVGGLKVYTDNVGRDKIILDMDFVYAGDAQFTVQACGFRGGLNQLVMSGKLRCTLQPLIPFPPFVGGCSGSLIELPKFDFNLTGMGEFVQLPGLIDAIRSIMNSQIANIAVLPNKIVVPLAPNIDITRLYFPELDGVIRLKIIEAMNLENKDISFLKKDKSDPYCQIQVGAQIYKTKTVNNDLNPVFNECFEAVVDQASGQKLRIELFDEDTAGADEELGRLSIPLEVVKKAGEIERWFHLEGCKHGELKLKVTWLNLSTNPANLKQTEWENEWITSDKPIHPAMLMVFVDYASDLPYPKSNLEPSPFIEATLGRYTQRTPVKPKTVNPLFQSKFLFFVKQPEGQDLKLKAYDDGTRRELGELTIPLLSIMNQPNMEIFQQTFHLVHGIHASPIVLTARLRTFVPPEGALDDFGVPSAIYGTGSHIERAERNIPPLAQNDMQSNNNINATSAVSNTNGSLALPVEPGKTVNAADSGQGPLNSLQPETQLNTSNFNSLKPSLSRSPSSVTASTSGGSTSLFRHGHNIVDKLKANKHTKKHKPAQNVPLGQLQMGLRYDNDNFKLYIDIICAKDLNPVEKNGRADPYVSIKLMPLEGATVTGHKGKAKTNVVQNSLNPYFDSQLYFDVHFSELQNYKLQLMVKDDLNYGTFSKPPVLGTLEISLNNFDPQKVIANQWINLEPPHR
ncbi:c2 domain-containing protein [Ditylenchus destructor]|uniref:C2 domain-containing protein n=1 Tax=Ditylenchus destructor TaxID=166010 RepID=A0AAD4RDV3_9BILA|nr:c2 domain-containing protein [Ditylenchus destructor]